MRVHQGEVLQTLRRVRAFLDNNEARLGLANTSTRRVLEQTIAELTEQAVTQERGARMSQGETQKATSLRFVLRHYHMRPIAEIARLHLRDIPEFASLRMPDWASVEELLAAASAMVDAARPHEPALILNGLSETFIADLEACAAELREVIDDRDGHRRDRSGATAGLAASERRGRAILKVLDGLVLIRVGADAQLTGEWLAARRLPRPTRPSSIEAASDESRSDESSFDESASRESTPEESTSHESTPVVPASPLTLVTVAA